MKNRLMRTARAGFTLIEVLVTLVLIALLVAVVLPSVMSQLSAGEAVRITEDVESMRSGAKMFRVDVKRWPGSLQQLVIQPSSWTSTPNDINDVAIPEGLKSRWQGPYLETGAIADETDSLTTAAGAQIVPEFEITALNGADFWTVRVANVDSALVTRIDLEIDGEDDDANGRIQIDVGNDTTYMLYLAAPIN